MKEEGEKEGNMDEMAVDEIVPTEIWPLIHEIRGRQVMLDRDLASIYHVLTKRLNEQVRRNRERFPREFMFQLTKGEMDELVANCDRFKMMKHSSVAMYAFTEQGVAMLSAVLKSDIAVRESIRIIKAFVAMRRTLASMTPVLARIEETERRRRENGRDRHSRSTRQPPQGDFVAGGIRELVVGCG